MSKGNYKIHADRKKYTFENWYKPMYFKNNSIISYIFDFEYLQKCRYGYMIYPYKDKNQIYKNIENCCKREKIINFIEKNNIMIEKNFFPFRLSGDTDNPSNSEPQDIHKFPNFSLMPVTGGMQLIKRVNPLKDYVDKNLKKYFESREIKDLPYRICGRKYKDKKIQDDKVSCEKELLKSFFDIFESLDEYCKNMYFLELQDIESLMVEEYWEKRKNIALKCGIKQEIMKVDVDSIKE